MPGELTVVVGCGRLGSFVAGELSRKGLGVVVLDRRGDAFQGLPPAFSGFTIEGDATEYGILERAGLGKAESVFACTDNDNVNILISQISIRLHSVKRVLARVYDKGRQELCTQLGVRTICPSEVLGGMFLEALNKEA